MNFSVQNLSLSFKGENLFKNLNVDFTGPGIFAILGPSGCGKSTLIRLLAGLQKPDKGQIVKPEKLRQGFIFQESHLLDWRNTFENVNLPLELKNISNDNAVQTELKNVGLEKSSRFYPQELSGGMKMRVSLARAFVINPEVLYCDEPFAALDEVTRESLQVHLREKVLASQGLAFFVTHNLSEALSVADQIFCFQEKGLLDPAPFLVDRKLGQKKQLDELRSKVRASF